MNRKNTPYRLMIALLVCLMQLAGTTVYGQERPRAGSKRQQSLQQTLQRLDSIAPPPPSQRDSISALPPDPTADSIADANRRNLEQMEAVVMPTLEEIPADTLPPAPPRRTWLPNPTKATWLALVIPGGGQIYNRKYWKLPIVYGGFAGCAYALTWNGKMYKDYSNAYKDAVNENWNSHTITDLLPPGYINRVSKTQLTETLRKRKDTYRRYRDMSIFAFIGVYLLSVVDAYVDAELSNFDIGPDLSMRLEPQALDHAPLGFSRKQVGLSASFSF